MSDNPELITSEDARAYVTALLPMVERNVGEGVPLPDDAVSMLADLAEWVNAVADVGGIDPE
jgi:hypothetical protein